MSWEVYIIEADNGKFYTGISNDLDKRFHNHQKGKGARFFRFSAPKKVLYREIQPNRSSALRREASLKKLTRAEKISLMNKPANLLLV